MPEEFDLDLLSYKYLPHWLVVAGIVLFVLFGWLWWAKVYESPYNVYWGMLRNSLATSSVTEHLTQQGSGMSLDQYITESFGTTNVAYGRTALTNTTSTVQTESIGTLTHDYVRYTTISTSQRTKSGKGLDVHGVLGKWAQAPAANTASQSAATPFFIQSMLGLTGGNLVPIADLSAADRAKLIQQLHANDIFSVDFNSVQKSKQQGRPVYTYTVSIEPVAYVGFEKAFAGMLGIRTLDSVDPNNYQSQSATKVLLTVDVRAHQLVGITYPGTKHAETFSSYDMPVNITTPHATISSQALQKLITSIR